MTPNEIETYVDDRIDARMELIADLAAKKAIQQVYADIGQGVLRKAAWVAGAAFLALLWWMAGKGISLPPAVR